MNKEEILAASRQEHRSQDLPQQEMMVQAGSAAFRAGSAVCCLISLISLSTSSVILYSPWAIYFSMISTLYLVRYQRGRRRSDLAVFLIFLSLTLLALAGLISRLTGTAQ